MTSRSTVGNCDFLIIGDSHSYAWLGTLKRGKSGNVRFRSTKLCHLGPVLAYNLLDNDGKQPGKWGELILKEIANEAPKIVLLVCGEIDIRTRALLYSYRNGVSLADEMANLAERVVRFASICVDYCGVSVAIAEPIPSAPSDQSYNESFPTVGNEFERNYATNSYVNHLKRMITNRCKKEIRCISVFHFLVESQDTNIHETRKSFLDDGLHLNIKGMAVLRNALTEFFTSQASHKAAYLPNLPPLFEFNSPRIKRIEFLATLSNEVSSFIKAKQTIQVGGRFGKLRIQFPYGVIIKNFSFRSELQCEWLVILDSSFNCNCISQSDGSLTFQADELGTVVKNILVSPREISFETYISDLAIEGVCFDPSI